MHSKCSQLLAFRTLLVSSKWCVTVQDNRYRNDHRKVFRRTLVVVLHRQDSARAFAHQHHHRGIVEKFLIVSGCLGLKSAHRGNGRACAGIRRSAGRGEGVGGEGRREGAHVCVRVWRQDTRDVEALQDGCAEVVERASIWSVSWLIKALCALRISPGDRRTYS
jgi:hypothetical protein